VQWIPILFSIISVGKVVDRFNRLVVAIIADVIAAGVAFFASWLIIDGGMNMYWLLFVLFTGAWCSTLYRVASQALIPEIIGSQSLLLGNSRLLFGQSVAKIAGQALTARLVVVNNGALVLFLDAISFLVRACLLCKLRSWNRQLNISGRAHCAALSFEEFRYLRARTDIARIIASQATMNVGGAIISGLFLVYAYRTLKLQPYHIAMMLMAGGIASAVASLLTTKITSALGSVRTASLALSGTAIAMWLIPLAREVAPFLMLLTYQVAFSIFGVLWHVCLLSYRQRVTPPQMLGRIASIDASLNAIAVVSGLLFATFIASSLSAETGILLGCAIASLSPIWLIGMPATPGGAGDPNRCAP
jgi:hypothetical protein